MTHHRVFFLVALFLMLVEASARAEEIPLMIPHTGTIAVGGTPFNGNGQFKFAIINGHADCNASPPGAGCAAYWSNDNTSTNGNEPTSGVTVSVSGGVFSIKLGDTALTNMQPIPTNVFNHTTTYLRVWFNDGATGFQQLSPDRQLVSVPYAFRAETANSVPGLGTSGTLNAEANPIDWTQLKNVPPGFADGVDQTGITSESDPTVLASVKDGISWSELSGVPAGFADGVDNTGGTSNDLVCSGCVESTDISNGAVTSAKIGAGAISGGSGGVIADGTITGADISPSAVLNVARLSYSSPRTHNFIVGSEAFVPGSNVAYTNTYGNGGASLTGGSGALVAPVHLPQGAAVTEFKVFFDDTSASTMTVHLDRQNMTGGGYAIITSVDSSGISGYGNKSTTAFSDRIIDNTIYSYHVYAWSTAWDSSLKIKGALVTYTVNEAP